MDNWIYRHFAAFVQFEVVQCSHVEDTPGKAGATLGHMDLVAVELAGLLYSRVQAEVSVEFLRGGKQVKGTHFRDQNNSA